MCVCVCVCHSEVRRAALDSVSEWTSPEMAKDCNARRVRYFRVFPRAGVVRSQIVSGWRRLRRNAMNPQCFVLILAVGTAQSAVWSGSLVSADQSALVQ